MMDDKIQIHNHPDPRQGLQEGELRQPGPQTSVEGPVTSRRIIVIKDGRFIDWANNTLEQGRSPAGQGP
jgi:hypothetical protein